MTLLGPTVATPVAGNVTLPVLAGSLGFLGLAALMAYWRQAQTPAAQAGRFWASA